MPSPADGDGKSHGTRVQIREIEDLSKIAIISADQRIIQAEEPAAAGSPEKRYLADDPWIVDRMNDIRLREDEVRYRSAPTDASRDVTGRSASKIKPALLPYTNAGCAEPAGTGDEPREWYLDHCIECCLRIYPFRSLPCGIRFRGPCPIRRG